MPRDYHDIQLPRVARQITFVSEADEPSDAADERLRANRHRIGHLAPFTGVLDTHLGGGRWRFLRLSYLLTNPLVVTERTEHVREVHHHHSTQQTVERRGTDTRWETDSPTTRTTRSHSPRITRLVTEQFPRATYLVSRHVEERRSGVMDRERGGRNTLTIFDRLDRTERDERPARAPLRDSSGPWRASTPSGRWVYRRARGDATVTETSRAVGERRSPGLTRHGSEEQTHERAGQETDTIPPGSGQYDRRAGFETGLSIRRLPLRIHRMAQSPAEGVRTGAPQPPGRDSLRVVRSDTAQVVRTDESRADRSAEPRTIVMQSVRIDSDSGRERRGQADGSAQPATQLQRQVARRRDRLSRPVDHPTVDHGRATRALRGLDRRADDPRSFEVVTRFQDTRPRASGTETGQQSPALAPADNPSERRVREVLREASSGASGLPGLETVVSPPREAVERIETRRGPPTVMRETRLQVADGRAGRRTDRSGYGPLGEPHRWQASTDASTQETPRNVALASPPVGDTTGDRPHLVHKRERHASDGERHNGRQAVESDERAARRRAHGRGQPAEGHRPPTEPYSSPEQHISALETLTDRHMAADPTIDRLVDHLFARLERKLRIERERRGR